MWQIRASLSLAHIWFFDLLNPYPGMCHCKVQEEVRDQFPWSCHWFTFIRSSGLHAGAAVIANRSATMPPADGYINFWLFTFRKSLFFYLVFKSISYPIRDLVDSKLENHLKQKLFRWLVYYHSIFLVHLKINKMNSTLRLIAVERDNITVYLR